MRLIDADALIEKMDEKYTFGECGRRERDDVVTALEFAPTIDPVKRGKWEMGVGYPFPEWTCSRCKCIFCGTKEFPKKYKFCPNCGAIIAEGEEDG